jgi:heme exporter protein B
VPTACLTCWPWLLFAALPGSFLLGLEGQALVAPLVALAIGTPALAALAVAVAALTAGLTRAGALGGLLLMPLAVPLVIFGAAAAGSDGQGALKLEAAIALLVVAGAPFVIGAAIRAART